MSNVCLDSTMSSCSSHSDYLDVLVAKQLLAYIHTYMYVPGIVQAWLATTVLLTLRALVGVEAVRSPECTYVQPHLVYPTPGLSDTGLSNTWFI
jgi:hypothetical protein